MGRPGRRGRTPHPNRRTRSRSRPLPPILLQIDKRLAEAETARRNVELRLSLLSESMKDCEREVRDRGHGDCEDCVKKEAVCSLWLLRGDDGLMAPASVARLCAQFAAYRPGLLFSPPLPPRCSSARRRRRTHGVASRRACFLAG